MKLKTMKSGKLIWKELFHKDNHPVYCLISGLLSTFLLLFFSSLISFQKGKYYQANTHIEKNTVTIAKRMDTSDKDLDSFEKETTDYESTMVNQLDFKDRIRSIRCTFSKSLSPNMIEGNWTCYFADEDLNLSNLFYFGNDNPCYLTKDKAIIVLKEGDVLSRKNEDVLRTLDISYEIISVPPYGNEVLSLSSPYRSPFMILGKQYWSKFSGSGLESVYYTIKISSELSDVELYRLAGQAGNNINIMVPIFDGFLHPLNHYVSQMVPLSSIEKIGWILSLIVEVSLLLFKVTSSILSFQNKIDLYLAERKLGFSRKRMIVEYACSQVLSFLGGSLLALTFYFGFQGIWFAIKGFLFCSFWFYSLYAIIPFALALVFELFYRNKKLKL